MLLLDMMQVDRFYHGNFLNFDNFFSHGLPMSQKEGEIAPSDAVSGGRGKRWNHIASPRLFKNCIELIVPYWLFSPPCHKVIRGCRGLLPRSPAHQQSCTLCGEELLFLENGQCGLAWLFSAIAGLDFVQRTGKSGGFFVDKT